MARSINKRSALSVNTLSSPGYYGDGGGGLLLRISKAGTKSWVFRFALDKKRRAMGLGAVCWRRRQINPQRRLGLTLALAPGAA